MGYSFCLTRRVLWSGSFVVVGHELVITIEAHGLAVRFVALQMPRVEVHPVRSSDALVTVPDASLDRLSAPDALVRLTRLA